MMRKTNPPPAVLADGDRPPALPQHLGPALLWGVAIISTALLGLVHLLQTELLAQGQRLAQDPAFCSAFVTINLPETTRLIFALLILLITAVLALLIPVLHAFRRQVAFLSESRERNRAIVDNMADGAIHIDESGRMIGMNLAAQAIFGYSLNETRGQPVSLLFAEPYRTEYNQRMRDLWTHEDEQTQTEVRELDGERKDGTHLPLYLAMSRVDVGHRHVFTAVVRDLTETRQQLEALARARDEALAADRAKSEFLAVMSHEIRTPMNGVLGMLELLRDSPLTDQQHDFITTAENSGELLLNVINDILEFSKIEAGKLDLQDLEFDLHGVIEEVTNLVASSVQAKTLEIASFIAPEVPAIIRGDPYRIRQVLMNLMGNAVKFTERGEVIIRVDLERAATTDCMVRFRISDTGIGIDSATLGMLFRPFTQADATTTRRFGGTGLGLVIAKRLVNLMGGEIGVDSTPGVGSTFWFTLNLQAVPDTPPREVGGLNGLRVLIVDDSATNRVILEHHLKRWGATTESVEGGQQALEALRRASAGDQPFALAILDMQMPGMDGIELAECIKADAALGATRLIMLSSLGYPGSRARLSGIEMTLLKPVRERLLHDAVAKLVGAARPAHRVRTAGAAPELPHFTARVLVAEDSPVNQKVITMMLSRFGVEQTLAADGQAAVAALAEGAYDLVLMDIQMPVLSGHDATRLIRAAELERGQGEHVPIVALTAGATTHDRVACLASGMDDYLSKPVQLASLEAALLRWLPAPKDAPQVPAPAP